MGHVLFAPGDDIILADLAHLVGLQHHEGLEYLAHHGMGQPMTATSRCRGG